MNESGMINVELDVAIEYGTKEWCEFVHTIIHHDLKYELIEEDGPGGGWPCIEISGQIDDLKKWFFDNYSKDEDDWDYLVLELGQVNNL